MIEGTVTATREARLLVHLQMANGHAFSVEAVLDTGFNGFLTLPPDIIARLGVQRLSRGRALLADNQEVVFDIYGVTVVWDGRIMTVEADGVDTTPLVGMGLLDQAELYMHVVPGGRVVITPKR